MIPTYSLRLCRPRNASGRPEILRSPLRIPLPSLPEKILASSDPCRPRQGKGQVSEMRKHEGRAAVGCLLRRDLEEELARASH